MISAKEKAVVLARVAEKHGGDLTPDLVVQESNPANPDGVARELAPLVEWHLTDSEAAAKRRADCARAVIRSCEPELIQLGVLRIEAPYYVHDPSKPPGEQGYRRLLSFKSEREVAEDVLAAERRRAVGALQRMYAVASGLDLEQEAADSLAALSVLGEVPAVGPEAGALGREAYADPE